MNRINSLFAVVVVLAVASVCHAQEKPALYVVSVGISKYHDKRFEHGVAYAAKDAQDFTSHFVAQRGKMFETVESKLLCDEQATRGNLEKALDWLQVNAKPNAYTMVFLSGHGGPNALGTYEYLVHDSNALVASTRIQGSWLRNRLQKIAGKRIVALDTCHSGGFGFRDAEFVGFASCNAKEQSGEHPYIQNGYFTHCFLEGLRGAADVNGDGQVTLAEAERYVREQLPSISKNRQNLTYHRPTTFAAEMPLSNVVPSVNTNANPNANAPSPTFKTGPRLLLPR